LKLEVQPSLPVKLNERKGGRYLIEPARKIG